MEFVFASVDLSYFCEEVFAARSGDDDPASRRIEAQSALDADRRCGPTGEVVLRVESEPPRIATDGGSDGASDEWAGYIALAVLNTRHRQDCLCCWEEIYITLSFCHRMIE